MWPVLGSEWAGSKLAFSTQSKGSGVATEKEKMGGVSGWGLGERIEELSEAFL